MKHQVPKLRGPKSVRSALTRSATGFAVVAALFVGPVIALSTTSPASADGVALAKGDVLAGAGNGQIFHFNNTGTKLDALDTTSGSTEDTGMCFDSLGNLYTTNFEANSMSKFDSSGNLVTASFGSGFNQDPESCVVDKSGNIYVGQADGSREILKFDSSGNLLASYSPATDDRGTDWIDLASDQCTMHYTGEGDLIKSFDVCTNTQLPDFATGLPGPCYAHRILSDGGELVACSSEVVRLDSSGSVVQTYTPPGLTDLFALNIDPDGTSFWTADYGTGEIWRIDLGTGSVITSFNASANVDVAGLAIVGEITQGGGGGNQTITPSGTDVTATEGQSSSNTQVASFTDTNTASTSSEFTAMINWGDSSTSTGTVSGSTGGPYTVTGTHTYAEEGKYTVTTSITDSGNSANDVSPTSQATVGDAALSAASCVTPPMSALAFSGALATFTDANTGAPTSDFSASINWGDASPLDTTSASFSGSGGSFTVNGSHTYASSGSYTISVTINDVGGSTTNTGTGCAATIVGNGSFVIGSRVSAVGSNVNFWGSQWNKNNPLGGSSAPASFKGFAISPSAPTCGSNMTFMSTTGNSPAPPAGPLQTDITVIVTSSVKQTGSIITGNIVHVVIVQTNPGYGPAPGHPGTGKVVSVVC